MEVTITRTWTDGNMLFPFFEGEVWKQEPDGRWKRSIWSVSDETMQEAMRYGAAEVIEPKV